MRGRRRRPAAWRGLVRVELLARGRVARRRAGAARRHAPEGQAGAGHDTVAREAGDGAVVGLAREDPGAAHQRGEGDVELYREVGAGGDAGDGDARRGVERAGQ